MQVYLGKQDADRSVAHIQTMLQGEGHWMVQDAGGAIYKICLEAPAGTPEACSPVMFFHAGGITGLDVSPVNHAAVTCGADGTVRLWNYIDKEVRVEGERGREHL